MIPEVNDRLTVRLLDRAVELASRVEDVSEDGLAIAAPTSRGVEVRLEPGLEVVLEWQTTWGPRACARRSAAPQTCASLRSWSSRKARLPSTSDGTSRESTSRSTSR